MSDPDNERRRADGVLLAVIAFTLWGCFPLYFYQLRDVSPLVTLAFRAIFTTPLLIPVVLLRGKGPALAAIFRLPKKLGILCATTFLIAANWGLFIWLVSRNLTLMSSLANYMTPLISVSLGAIFLRERLTRASACSVALVVVAVCVYSAGLGRVPWEAILTAGFFSVYSLLRKVADVDSTAALCVETMFFTPPALLFLIWAVRNLPPTAATLQTPLLLALLVGSGLLTAIPLLLFGSAACRIRLMTLGMIQYITPSLQFLCAVCFLHEKMAFFQWVSFFIVWIALALFSAASIERHHHHQEWGAH